MTGGIKHKELQTNVGYISRMIILACFMNIERWGDPLYLVSLLVKCLLYAYSAGHLLAFPY